MNGTVDITKVLNPPITYLSVGDSFDLDFTPFAGAITADVGWVRNVDVAQPEPEPGVDIDFPERIKFLVELFRSGSNEAVASKSIAGDARRDLPNLNHRVQPDATGRIWRCRFTNQGVWDVRFRPRVTFVEQILELEQTALPVRVLNHGLSQLVRALELKIHLDRNGSYVDFSEEFKRLANGTITRLNFSLPGLDGVQDVNLSTLDAQVIAPIHTSHGQVQYGPPLIRIHVQF